MLYFCFINVLESRLLCSQRLHLFDTKYSKVVQYKINVIYLNILKKLIDFCDQSCIFSIIISVFMSHDPQKSF